MKERKCEWIKNEKKSKKDGTNKNNKKILIKQWKEEVKKKPQVKKKKEIDEKIKEK